jgi:NADPH:quinone reductase-like Zn-dependent oxidoreductase
MRGVPYLMRPQSGLRKPKKSFVGHDIAGQVETVGKHVTGFRSGDEVFADVGAGGFAELASVPEGDLVLKPVNLKFEQAAAVPLAAVTALQGLRDAGQIQPEHKVLIIGASGGVGTFAVQIAKSFGADVTGVCSTRNEELIEAAKVSPVIDRTYSLSEVPDAIRYLEEGHARGKVVITS